jgi:peptide/nickel transport system ATP-binding protein
MQSVTVDLGRGNDRVRVLDEVSLAIHPGEIHCLVGESGCGKTTTGRVLAGLLAPTSGHVLVEGTALDELSPRVQTAARLGIQYVHQDPYASLNPSQTVLQQLSAPLRRHGLARGSEVRERCLALLETVRLTPAEEVLSKYPHQLSGGQRQRLSIARVLSVGPRVIIADEAVSMIDVSLRISLLDVLKELVADLQVGLLFITHDLAAARYVGGNGTMSVMYLGRVVESGRTSAVIDDPQHPYTRALIDAVPADPREGRAPVAVDRYVDSSDVPSLRRIPSGCAFHPRCRSAIDGVCDTDVPDLSTATSAGHVACHAVQRAAGVGGT